MAVNSIRKGNKFELATAKMLGEAICGDSKAFMRMPLHGRSLERFSGDIIPNLDPRLPEKTRSLAAGFAKLCLVDAKDRKKWTLDGLVVSKDSEPWKWWDKLTKSAEDIKKEPLMVVKYNHRVWAMLRSGSNLRALVNPADQFEITAHGYRVCLFPWDGMGTLDRQKLEVMVNGEGSKEKGAEGAQ